MGGGGEGGERKGRRVTGGTKAPSQIAHSPHDVACMDDAVANVTSSSFTCSDGKLHTLLKKHKQHFVTYK